MAEHHIDIVGVESSILSRRTSFTQKEHMKIEEMTDEELIEDFDCFCVACSEDPEDIGSSHQKYLLELELLRRMKKE